MKYAKDFSIINEPDDGCDVDAGAKAMPVGHQEDSTGHQNGVGHDHLSNGYANGKGHQKFHGDEDCDADKADPKQATFEEPKEDEPDDTCEDDAGAKATPVGHQEDSNGHQNGVGHDHESTGYANGIGHQKFHGDEDCETDKADPKQATSEEPKDDEPDDTCEDDAGAKATPVGHQEDSTGHQNGVGHDHESTGYANGIGHQKFHGDDDCEEDKAADIFNALFNLPPLSEDNAPAEMQDGEDMELGDFG